MAEIILITGGSRSGKSAFAQQLAEQIDGSRLFLATCPIMDAEIAARIRRHREDRRGRGWHTEEEPLAVAGRIRSASAYDVILVDCLTLWINNLLYDAQRSGLEVDENSVQGMCGEIADASRQHKGRVIFVTNEVGSGIVPENQTARLYRDLVGRANQAMAAAADSVFLVSCGIPLKIKGKGNEV